MTVRIDGHIYQPGTTPAPELVRAARKAAGHNQTQAARAVHRASYQRWQAWESGQHEMDPAVFGYYLFVTGQARPGED